MTAEFISVPDGWEVRPLIECTLDGVVSYGIVQPGAHDEKGVPIVRVNNFDNNTLDTSSVLRVSHEVEAKYARTRLEGGEVLLTLVGSTGQSVVVPKTLAGWNVPRAIAVIRPADDVGAEWINICLQSSATAQYLDSRANTTVQKTLNLKDVKQIPVLLPPKEIKDFIESVVGSLNSKIELNRQINATLESMAQALFKSWFVDFDPVIDNALAAGNPIPEPLQARAEKRAALLSAASAADTRSANATDNAHPTQTAPHAQPGTTPPATPLQPLPADLRALFPDSFVFDEEMGWVPEGWPVGLLDEISHYGSERISVGEIGHANYVSTENLIPERGGVREASSLPTSEWVPAFTDGSILVSNIRPYFKKIWLARGVGGRSNDVLGFESKLDGAEEYLYCLLNQDKFFDYMMATAKGTKMPRGDKKAIMNWPVIIPSPKLMREFSCMIRVFFLSVQARSEQSLSLSSVRDLMLPKLLSGQIQIPEVDRLVAEAL